MATARLTLGIIGKDGAQVMLPISDEQVTFTSSAQSSAFDGVNIVRFIADADAYIVFNTNPTADANDMYIPANTIEYFAIRQGEKMAIYDGTT